MRHKSGDRQMKRRLGPLLVLLAILLAACASEAKMIAEVAEVQAEVGYSIVLPRELPKGVEFASIQIDPGYEDLVKLLGKENVAPPKVHHYYSKEVNGQTVTALHITQAPNGINNASEHEEVAIGSTTGQLTETPTVLALVFNDGESGFMLDTAVLSRTELMAIAESMLSPK